MKAVLTVFVALLAAVPLAAQLRAPHPFWEFDAVHLRSWDRAERVHAAMLSRGFTGTWPVTRELHFSWRDAAFLLFVCALFLAARWLP